MSGRRALFTSLLRLGEADPDGPGWPRPPGALSEADFLRACTRCGDCIEACPHGAIGTLPSGPTAGTPAMNPNVAPCHLCEDTPCITACEDGALAPVGAAGILLGIAMVDPERCLPFRGPECGACRNSCPVGALHTSLGRPSIDSKVCNGCGLCRADCPVWDKAIEIIF
ncbi:MAG: 4Fe-4S binding protein [Alphaproteobacteria bacterium]|nr:4Fe-4S binding protein [Alphaproteobacteria bacterium]